MYSVSQTRPKSFINGLSHSILPHFFLEWGVVTTINATMLFFQAVLSGLSTLSFGSFVLPHIYLKLDKNVIKFQRSLDSLLASRFVFVLSEFTVWTMVCSWCGLLSKDFFLKSNDNKHVSNNEFLCEERFQTFPYWIASLTPVINSHSHYPTLRSKDHVIWIFLMECFM